MDKRKLKSLYVVLGVFGLMLFNAPVINLFMGRNFYGIPTILFYLVLVVVFISVSGFLISRYKEE